MPNIIIAGVGGQGSLLASRILGSFFRSEGLDVKVSEVHGMSQRGGSVVTYVRAGDTVYSPIVPEGEADYLIAFEELEALRYMHNLKKGGVLAVNTQRISPMPVITGTVPYPGDVLEQIRKRGFRLTAIDALALAGEAGNLKTVNVVMMGALAKVAGFSRADFEAAIASVVPERFRELNIDAFELGYSKA